MKMAPILRALSRYPEFRTTLIHTGQHYDANLSDVFFHQLKMPRPDVHLEVGSGSHAQQTARVMEKMETVLLTHLPSGERFHWVIVVGDVNSTMAATLAAAKLQIPVAHVEAGLRSFDRTMPEEINRVVTDAIADLLFVSEPTGVENLRQEGRTGDQVHLVGNVMIDTLFDQLESAQSLDLLSEYGLTPRGYAVVTLHRPSNVDDPKVLAGLVEVLIDVSARLPIVFPIHPRTLSKLQAFDLESRLYDAPGIYRLPPLGYRECLCLTSQARVIVTDSGGLQEESTVLDVPCLTMRENTERPSTVDEGSSTLIGNDLGLLQQHLKLVLSGTYKRGRVPKLWDGRAGGRIAAILALKESSCCVTANQSRLDLSDLRRA
jgi:UDP-N-acetylglucosamine 2-epimerase (non-hydrolysing)